MSNTVGFYASIRHLTIPRTARRTSFHSAAIIEVHGFILAICGWLSHDQRRGETVPCRPLPWTIIGNRRGSDPKKHKSKPATSAVIATKWKTKERRLSSGDYLLRLERKVSGAFPNAERGKWAIWIIFSDREAHFPVNKLAVRRANG